jgi:hypothetical protein
MAQQRRRLVGKRMLQPRRRLIDMNAHDRITRSVVLDVGNTKRWCGWTTWMAGTKPGHDLARRELHA